MKEIVINFTTINFREIICFALFLYCLLIIYLTIDDNKKSKEEERRKLIEKDWWHTYNN